MGTKYGSLLAKNGFQLPVISAEKTEFGLESWPLLQSFYPEVIDEITGFATAIGEEPETLGAFLLSIGAFDTSGQCSVFAFRNANSTLIGRNYDMLYTFKKFTESSLIAPENKYAYISQSDVFIGRCDGINEHGLFAAMSFVNGKTIQPGVGFHFVIRKVLETCRTTDEAIRIIQEALVSSSTNFILADRTGSLAVVESAPERSHVIRPSPKTPFVHITNQFVSTEMKPLDRGNVSWSKSWERYCALQKKVDKANLVSLDQVKEILSDASIRLDLKKEQFGTIWSVVADLSTLQIERAETQPKTSRFKPETRLNWWLTKRNK